MIYTAGPNAHCIPYSLNLLEWGTTLKGNLFNGKFFLFWGGIILNGLFQARCGWLMHEGGHGSLTGNMTTDRWIQEIFIGIGLGESHMNLFFQILRKNCLVTNLSIFPGLKMISCR